MMTDYRAPRPARRVRGRWLPGGMGVALVMVALLARPASGRAQQAVTAALVLDHVTVVDVEQGNLLADQRVVIKGNRIQRMGKGDAAPVPAGAQLVDARGKYLIPGLWDLHVHPDVIEYATDFMYPLLLANGVTGYRDAHTMNVVPLDTLRRWRREILAGTRIGPPRQVLTSFHMVDADCSSGKPVKRGSIPGQRLICVGDTAEVRFLVDSVKAAGADMVKTYDLTPATYFLVAAEARRIGIRFGGHLPGPKGRVWVSAAAASDSGASILDHLIMMGGIVEACLLGNLPVRDTAGPDGSVVFVRDPGSVDRCRPLADKFRRNNTWFVPTTIVYTAMVGLQSSLPIEDSLHAFAADFWAGTVLRRSWLESPILSDTVGGAFAVAQQVGLPIMAGTDATTGSLPRMPAGFSTHAELAVLVTEGLTPLQALQAATLNPAKFLRGTDSLGTVAPGKLADLVLLDGNPLADITKTLAIRAVIANGRYFDRAALDQILAEVQAKGKAKGAELGQGGP